MTHRTGVMRRRMRSVAAVVSPLVILPLAIAAWQSQSGGRAADEAAVSGADLLRAIELPRAAQDARAAGIAEKDLVRTLQLLQAREIPAADAREVLSAYLRLGLAARGESLAPQVEERLEGGVRGAALADALRSSGRALAAPVGTQLPAPRRVPTDTAGEPRPLRDTTRLPPAPRRVPTDTAGERRPLRDTSRVIPPGGVQ